MCTNGGGVGEVERMRRVDAVTERTVSQVEARRQHEGIVEETSRYVNIDRKRRDFKVIAIKVRLDRRYVTVPVRLVHDRQRQHVNQLDVVARNDDTSGIVLRDAHTDVYRYSINREQAINSSGTRQIDLNCLRLLNCVRCIKLVSKVPHKTHVLFYFYCTKTFNFKFILGSFFLRNNREDSLGLQKSVPTAV